MSGGHFDYKQHHIADIINDIEQVIRNETSPDYAGYKGGYSEGTINVFRNAMAYLQIAQVLTHRIDWLLSGDDGEETFHKRLTNDLRALKDLYKRAEDDQ